MLATFYRRMALSFADCVLPVCCDSGGKRAARAEGSHTTVAADAGWISLVWLSGLAFLVPWRSWRLRSDKIDEDAQNKSYDNHFPHSCFVKLRLILILIMFCQTFAQVVAFVALCAAAALSLPLGNLLFPPSASIL